MAVRGKRLTADLIAEVAAIAGNRLKPEAAALAQDFIRQGIRCNAICPGTIESPSWHGRVEELGKSVGGADKALAMFVERQPMGRVGRPEEVAALAVYLASDAAAFTTGTAIPIDGGWTL